MKEKKENAAHDEPVLEDQPDAQLAEVKDLLLRTQASFENYKKLQEQRIVEIQQYAAKHIITELLPIIDNFELAIKNKGEIVNEFVKGIELIYGQLQTLLEKQHITIISTVGKDFDPYKHEALLKVPSDKPENTVLEEFQKGYMLHNKVLRHARVKISAGNARQEDTQNKQQQKQQGKNHPKEE